MLTLMVSRPRRSSTATFFHLAQGYFSVYKLIYTRKLLQLASGFLADVQDIPLLMRCCSRNRKKDLIDMILIYIEKNIVSSAYHRNSFHVSSPFIWIVIDQAAYSGIGFLCILKLPDNCLPASPAPMIITFLLRSSRSLFSLRFRSRSTKR